MFTNKQTNKQTNKLAKTLAGFALTVALTNSAFATTLSIAADGTLMGAFGVNVNGTLYDVTFGDDVLANGITAFTTETDAYAASQALIDQVMLGDYGLTGSKFINGCTSTSVCKILTVYSISTSRGLPANYDSVNIDLSTGSIYLEQIPRGATSSTNSNVWATSTIAKWTVSAPAVSAVPVPAAAWLFATGLPVVGAFARRRKQQA